MGPVITIMGPIGSGKSVQAEIISKKLGWRTISAGKLIRQSDRQDIKDLVNDGKPAPSEFTQNLIMTEIKAIEPGVGIVLDGTHRLAEEAKYFDEQFPKIGRKLNLVIALDLDEAEITKRLSERSRDDDHPEAIRSRMDWYENDILPIIQNYEKSGLVRHVDASGSMEEVTDLIMSTLQQTGLVGKGQA